MHALMIIIAPLYSSDTTLTAHGQLSKQLPTLLNEHKKTFFIYTEDFEP